MAKAMSVRIFWHQVRLYIASSTWHIQLTCLLSSCSSQLGLSHLFSRPLLQFISAHCYFLAFLPYYISLMFFCTLIPQNWPTVILDVDSLCSMFHPNLLLHKLLLRWPAETAVNQAKCSPLTMSGISHLPGN